MGDSALTDPGAFPSEELIGEKLGRAKAAYAAVFGFLGSAFPEIRGEWKYYNDTKCWLLKAPLKGKTVFWLSVVPGFFRVTFYLGAAMDEAVRSSGLPEAAKEGFAASSGKKFRGLSLELKAKKDLAAFKEALGLKLASP
jgi:hypothetical protein